MMPWPYHVKRALDDMQHASHHPLSASITELKDGDICQGQLALYSYRPITIEHVIPTLLPLDVEKKANVLSKTTYLYRSFVEPCQ